MKNIKNKKLMTFGIIGLLAMVMVSAGLVSYWGQTQVDMKVQEAITTIGGECEFSVVAGDGAYKLCLFEMKNNLERELDLDVTIKVQQKIGTNIYTILPDDEGVLVAVTEDISYCFSSQGNMDGITYCSTDYETWMENNLDWLDWIVTQPYEGEYDTSLITNHGGDSITDISSIGINGEYAISNVEDVTIKSLDEVQVALYVGSATELEAGDYRVIFEVAPKSA